MLRRLYHDQPESFAFTPENEAWARAQMTKFPEGRQASAIIPLLWRAQEQEGWLSRAAIEHVAGMLDLAYIRALEVATFYFMFQLQPVGSVAHLQICGTTSCMIMGAENLVEVCKAKIGKAHALSADGKFSWEEVECLGACSNAPMAQIGKDYYEDLTPEKLEALIDAMARGEVPMPGPQDGRYCAEPASGLTSLKDHEAERPAHNASVALAVILKDTLKRIDGTEEPLTTPWLGKPEGAGKGSEAKSAPKKATGAAKALKKNEEEKVAKPDTGEAAGQVKPEMRAAARDGGPDDLKQIKGVGPKLEALLHRMGVFHFDQIAAWSAEEIAWVDENLEGFKGRVSRDDWVAQAKVLATGGETEFSKRAKY